MGIGIGDHTQIQNQEEKFSIYKAANRDATAQKLSGDTEREREREKNQWLISVSMEGGRW